MDTEARSSPRLVPPACRSARIACHRPRLDTHTLTASVLPGRQPPTLQSSVEQLLLLRRRMGDEVRGAGQEPRSRHHS